MPSRYAAPLACVLLGPALLFFSASAQAQSPDPSAPAPLPHVSLHPGAPEQPQPAAAPSAAPALAPADAPAAEAPAAPGPPANATPETPAAAPETAPAPLAAAATTAQPAPIPTKPAKPAKKGKEEYTGPTEIVTLPPTPMLDEEGKQRLDPEGKPMFNPPVKQQRDKKGHPVFENGKPVFQTATELGYDEHGKKLHAEKVKPPKMIPVSVSRGTFTVDGIIGKAELNYEIPDLHFIYFFVPGVGVTIVSNHEFPGSKAQPDAFNDLTLTVKVDDHTMQLASDKRLLGKKPEPAFVAVDRNYQLTSRYPIVGYGTLYKPPYQWPGSHENGQLAGVVAPPPIPKNLQPTLLLSPCPKGQMRLPAPPVQPGQQALPQPCVPIAQAQAAAAKMKPAATPAPAVQPTQ